LPVDTEIRNVEAHVSPERPDTTECTGKPPSYQVEKNPFQPLPKPAHYTGAAQEESILRCPYPECRKAYIRNQDLVRYCIERMFYQINASILLTFFGRP
jgi:hypothetical protein